MIVLGQVALKYDEMTDEQVQRIFDRLPEPVAVSNRGKRNNLNEPFDAELKSLIRRNAAANITYSVSRRTQ